MSDQIGIVIEGTTFTGWKTASIRRDLTALCGSFSISLADEQTGKNWSLAAQKDCVIKIGDDTVLTGFIDSVDFEIDSGSHTVTLQGRDKTADLVDCAAGIDKKGNPNFKLIQKTDLLGIAKILLAPFDQSVRIGSEALAHTIGEKFARFAIQRGETVFEALDRAAKQRGIILVTDSLGVLFLTMSGTTKAVDALKYGENVKATKGTYDYANRYSLYRVETQVANAGKAVGSLWGDSTQVVGVRKDEDVSRFRPIIISAEADSTKNSCKTRASFEALYRAASSQNFEVVFPGWRQSNGKLWVVNQTVETDIPPLYLKEELLITGITYEFDLQDGSRTTLNLLRKDAFNNQRALEALTIKDPKGTKVNW